MIRRNGIRELDAMFDTGPMPASACTSELQLYAYSWLASILDSLESQGYLDHLLDLDAQEPLWD